MNIPDIINGTFEAIAGIIMLLNIRQVYHDKKVRGISMASCLFFLLWGYWNLYYYPQLEQWFSVVGGVILVTTNTIWVGMMMHYIKKEPSIWRYEDNDFTKRADMGTG